MLAHLDPEVARIPLDAFDLCQGNQFDVVVPADLDQFGGQDSH
jgi:hypothetical protein